MLVLVGVDTDDHLDGRIVALAVVAVMRKLLVLEHEQGISIKYWTI